jgi:hypothetical protein
MGTGDLTKEQLTQLLRQAEAAHADYEKKLGKRDDDWPAWYAVFILDQLREGTGGSTSGGSW